MKRTEFNELIEKAFSMGYEYAQKEFGAVKRENKKKKREWLKKLGEELSKSESTHDAARDIASSISTNKFNKVLKNNPLSAINYIGGPSKEEVNSIKDSDININVGRRKIRRNDKSWGSYYRTDNQSLNDIINSRQKSKKESNHKLEDFNKNVLEHYKDSKDYEHIRDYFYLKNRMNRKDAENNKKNLKKAALIGAGILGTGIAAYAGKKAYNKYKAKKQKEQEEKENKNK